MSAGAARQPNGDDVKDTELVCKHCGDSIVKYGSSNPPKYRHVYVRGEGQPDVFLSWCPIGIQKAEL